MIDIKQVSVVIIIVCTPNNDILSHHVVAIFAPSSHVCQSDVDAVIRLVGADLLADGAGVEEEVLSVSKPACTPR